MIEAGGGEDFVAFRVEGATRSLGDAVSGDNELVLPLLGALSERPIAALILSISLGTWRAGIRVF
jgi:hypothetical protein